MRKTLLLLSLLSAVAVPACAAGDARSSMPSPIISDDNGPSGAIAAVGAVGIGLLFLYWQAH